MRDRETNVVEAVSLSASRPIASSGQRLRSFSILLFSVFVAVDLLALVAGASAYGSITKMQEANDRQVMTLGPITSAIRANDAAGGVANGTGPEGRALVLVRQDDQGAYETRIYLYQGKIVQEFALQGSPYTPSKATVLAESSSFDFWYEDGLLTVSTDSGTAKIALRYLQGGA